MRPENCNHAHNFDWELYPQAENFLIQHINTFLENNSFARTLSSSIEHETSTLFLDWIDHMVLPENIVSEKALDEFGFRRMDSVEAPPDMKVFMHPGAIFFPVLLTKGRCTEVILKPERLDHFVQMLGKGFSIEGCICGHYRKAVIFHQDNSILSAVERRGYNGFLLSADAHDAQEYRQALEIFFCRQRYFEDPEEGMNATLLLIKNLCKKLSLARVTDAFFRAERVYWERKNSAGQTQKARQDRLGLGWGNHDHHTYRTSRNNFTRLIKIFETLGFVCREQFFAGEEAGWGAQVLEHLQCNIVLFTDVDLLKEEKSKDFSHYDLEQTTRLGTVGLWVELHGESMLQAGLHHLAARFNFEKIRTDLKRQNINTMNPFSYFEFLKQAFTAAETWKVEPKRLNKLFEKSAITRAQYETFLRNGTIGSHLENLQRTQGFKGFNQRSVSAIIKATDPREYKFQGA